MGHRFEIEYFWGGGFDIEKRPDKWTWTTQWEGDSFLTAIFRLYQIRKLGYPQTRLVCR